MTERQGYGEVGSGLPSAPPKSRKELGSVAVDKWNRRSEKEMFKVVKTRKRHDCASDFCKRRPKKFEGVMMEIPKGEQAKVVSRREIRYNTYWETYYFHMECPMIVNGDELY